MPRLLCNSPAVMKANTPISSKRTYSPKYVWRFRLSPFSFRCIRSEPRGKWNAGSFTGELSRYSIVVHSLFKEGVVIASQPSQSFLMVPIRQPIGCPAAPKPGVACPCPHPSKPPLFPRYTALLFNCPCQDPGTAQDRYGVSLIGYPGLYNFFACPSVKVRPGLQAAKNDHGIFSPNCVRLGHTIVFSGTFAPDHRRPIRGLQ